MCLLEVQFKINLATHDVISVSKPRWRVSSASVAPMNNFFTCFASASISLLGLVCTTTVYISGCSASVVSLGRFLDALQKVCSCSPHQLDFGLFHTSPLHKGFGNNLCHSIGHKLFVVPLTGNPIPRHCSLCPSIHRPHYINPSKVLLTLSSSLAALLAEMSSNLVMVNPPFHNRAFAANRPFLIPES